MGNYTVSARKYRPADFSSVVGQQHITHTLKNALKNNQLAQAFLFCGPRGIGKTTCARILAKTVNCQAITEAGEACNQCEPCQSFNSNQSFNFYELDAASNNSVEDIRNLVDQVRFPPQSGKYKVYIIDEVHMLSQSAFNAFLKTLEEPPPYAIFILATTEKHKILPTILSRCQIFDFNRIGIKDIAEHLKGICEKEKIEAEDDALFLIAQKADGALRDSLSILDRIISFAGDKITYQGVVDNLNILDYDYFLKMTDLVYGKDLPAALLLLNDIVDKGFDLHNFLNGMCSHFRDLIMCRHEATNKLLELPESIANAYKEQAQKIDEAYLLSALNILNQFDVNFKGSKNQRLHLELALMKLCYLNEAISLAEMAEQPEEAGKKKVAESAKTSENKAGTNNGGTTANGSNKANKVPSSPSLKGVSQIKSTLKEQEQKETPAKEHNDKEAEKEQKTSATNTPVPEQDKILHAWQSFREELKTSKPSLEAALNDEKITFPESGVMEATLPSQASKEMLLDHKNRFLEILREETAWDDLTVEVKVEVTPQETLKKHEDSPKKRYEKMLEKNPEIETLQQKFDLRPDSNR